MTYTRDEIMSLDAAQLRLAIAEAKGWKWFELEDGSKLLRKEKDFNYGAQMSIYGNITFLAGGLQDWPASIAAAWELVEELPQPKRIHEDEGFVVMVGGYSYGAHSDLESEYDATDDTAPLAICRAWLLWKSQC